MRLRSLYTNRAKVRPPIVFRDGLNVVLGEIRHPEDRDEDTHNLGKSLLAQVIDFCLLKEKRKEHFLVKHAELFQGLAFHLEVETETGTFVTIRRGVDTASKASFKVHDSPNQDFTKLAEDEWTHWQLPFQRAVQALDGYLALTAIAPWSFRKIIGYSLRTQRDYDQPFKLSKFGGKHAEWKPLLAHVIGLDSAPISRSYEIIEEVIDRKASLYTSLNEEGNIEFHTEILDAGGHETSAGDGNTYSRLLCMAFDLAVARAYVNEAFPHFLYHDGALETLDDRKKLNLIQVLRDDSALGVQILITAIDSELPPTPGDKQLFTDDELVLLLHDDGRDGRLFRMPTW